MKEKDLIKSYFENYYPKNKKYVYKEDFGIGSVIFLFLLFLMIKVFSRSNSNEISKKIDNNPSIPFKIIKNLENIKDILIKDNPNKDLKEVLILIDKLDDNLNLLSSTSNRNKVIQDITDQIIRFLELVTEMYSNQTPDKKDRLFNELNKILSIFGLSEMFKKLLEVANNKGQIKADNNNEVVSLSPDDLKKLVLEDDEDDIQQDEDDEDDEVLNFDEIGLDYLNDEEDEEENEEESLRIKKILENKDIDEIKKFIIDKKTFVKNSSYVDIKESFEYIINNFKEYSNEELKQLYIILYDNKDIISFSEAFGDSDIYRKTADKIEQFKDLEATLTDYDKLLNYLKTKKIYIEEYKHNRQFIIKINLEEYKFGKIVPLKNNDSSKNYYLMFHEENNKFDIYIDPQDIDSYRLYDTFFRFLFENINILNLKKVCEGNWKFTSDDQKINFSVTKYYSGFEKTNIESVIINSKTFISKQYRTAIKEQKPTNPLDDNLYYYCIKIDDSNIFVTEIKGDFLRFLKELFAKKFFKYKTYNNQVKIYNFTDNQNLSDLISIDCNTDKNHQFLQKISSGNSKISFDDQLFKKVNPYFVNQERGFTIIKTTGSWFQN